MKKHIFKSAFVLFLIVGFSFSGCILDALDTLTTNVPISKTFTINSSASSFEQSETIDLSDSKTYQSYSNKIQNISFARAAYRTETVSPSDLSADIAITLKDKDGNLLFTYPLGNIKPADYKDKQYELNLNSAQIGLINAYLSTLSNKVFNATISVTNIQSSVKPYTLVGIIDVAFQMKVKTN